MEFAINGTKESLQVIKQPGKEIYCSGILEKYRVACGRNIIQVMSRLGEYSLEKAVAVCEGVHDGIVREHCVSSVGMKLVAERSDVDYVILGCGRFKNNIMASLCITAGAKEMVFQKVFSWEVKSNALCTSLKLRYKENCIQLVEQVKKDYGR